MSDADEPRDQGNKGQPRAARGARLLAALGLLFGLAGAAGAAYLYYSLILLGPAADIGERMAELREEQAQLRAHLGRLTSEQRTAFEALEAEQRQRQRAAEESLARQLDRLAVPEPAGEREWKLAEAERLLRLANQRLPMERDTKQAVGRLQSADDLLAGLDEDATRGVRATLADEIRRLEQVAFVDVAELYLRLDAVKRQLGTLALDAPEYTLDEPGPAPATAPTAMPDDAASGPGREAELANTPVAGEEAFSLTPPAPTAAGNEHGTAPADSGNEAPGLLNALVSEFGRLVRFRRIDTGFTRPPVPAEAVYLELNLRLMLEQAQLAALRYDQAAYAASLGSAVEWARAYLDGQNPEVLATLDSLEALRGLNLQTPLPDISGSLHELLRARRERP